MVKRWTPSGFPNDCMDALELLLFLFLFLTIKHVALDTPFPWTLREGAKGVQLAELGLQSWAQRKWLPVNELPPR